MPHSKFTTETNYRSKDATIAQSGENLPSDSGKPVDINDEESVRFEQILRGMGGAMPAGPEILDEAMQEANKVADELQGVKADVEGHAGQKLENQT